MVINETKEKTIPYNDKIINFNDKKLYWRIDQRVLKS